MKKAIITGITGQDGAYLAKKLLNEGFEVIGFVSNNSMSNDRFNLRYLGIIDEIRYCGVDLTNKDDVMAIVEKERPHQIYNLAAQSSVAKSFSNPGETLAFNFNSVINILESVLAVDKTIRFYQASSSEMFGKVKNLPVKIEHPLNPISPYAVSKVAAHHTVKSYRTAYGLYAVSGVLFNHESYLRSPNFFCKKIIRQGIEIANGKRDVLELGNIEVKRDFGYGPDYVDAMYKMLQQIEPRDYIISSGESISLKEIVYQVFDLLGISHDKIVINPELYRPEEIEDIYGDNTLAKRLLGWNYNKDFFSVLRLLIDEELKNSKEIEHK